MKKGIIGVLSLLTGAAVGAAAGAVSAGKNAGEDAYWKTGDLSLIDRFLQAGLRPLDKDYSGKDLFHYIGENKADAGRKNALLEHLKTTGILRQS